MITTVPPVVGKEVREDPGEGDRPVMVGDT
jgi:hypothetical protein